MNILEDVVSALYRMEKRIVLRIDETERKLMSGLTDLQAAVAALTTEVGTILADIATALQNDDSDAAVEAASQIVTQATANLAAGDPLTGSGS
jgi:hypothetical protein